MNTAILMITHSLSCDGFLSVDPEGQSVECEWKSGSQVQILHVVLSKNKKSLSLVSVTESTAEFPFRCYSSRL